ncbi:acylneuraminate cytidylyltransferase family protein [Vibrio sp. Isolate25]|uniref:acylneuraminate cytidylyltransferase family protein n=1 Tax=Vibrio sp. Isolate25 TaxID=2908535 RepID=UPI001EFEC2F4|nr:acylneuraminate cytidylyltransferase family protein [Vibrio sp. Isolate25]MCG9597826.1 acylneuraminate cytidylyltransferase family protein [Vibrio sp. Isolate25]
MKSLGIIPARGGSKGIPQKNIKLLNGKPLIAYTIEAALSSNLDIVVVSTDCDKIAEVAYSYSAEVFFRDEVLSGDLVPTLPVIQDVVNRSDEQFDAIVTLQPTSPLRSCLHINEALELFSCDDDADSLVSVVEVPHNFSPEKLMTLEGRYLKGDNSPKRRQDVERLFARNGAAIYITRNSNIQDYIFGGRVIPYFMSKLDSFDIDDIEDWEIVEKILY